MSTDAVFNFSLPQDATLKLRYVGNNLCKSSSKKDQFWHIVKAPFLNCDWISLTASLQQSYFRNASSNCSSLLGCSCKTKLLALKRVYTDLCIDWIIVHCLKSRFNICDSAAEQGTCAAMKNVYIVHTNRDSALTYSSLTDWIHLATRTCRNRRTRRVRGRLSNPTRVGFGFR